MLPLIASLSSIIILSVSSTSLIVASSALILLVSLIILFATLIFLSLVLNIVVLLREIVVEVYSFRILDFYFLEFLGFVLLVELEPKKSICFDMLVS